METDKIISLQDENGEDQEFEIIATLEINEDEYAVLLPLDGSDEAVIFKVVEEIDGESVLEYVNDDDEFDMVAKAYEELVKNSN